MRQAEAVEEICRAPVSDPPPGRNLHDPYETCLSLTEQSRIDVALRQELHASATPTKFRK